MEKVKITQKAANLIENTRKKMSDHEIVRKHEDIILIKKGTMDLDTLIKALYIGYEVDPEFKIGDWVKSRHGVGIGKIVKFSELGYYTDFNMIVTDEDIRHATPEEIATEKERRFFAENGRDPWELKRYDNLSAGEGGSTSHTVWETNDDGVVFNEFCIFKSWNEIKEDFKVSCFAHDRKDS